MKRYPIRSSILLKFFGFSIVPILLIAIILRIVYVDNDIKMSDYGPILSIALVIIFFAPAILLTMTYLLEDIRKKVFISSDNRSLIIEKNDKKYSIEKKDILQLYNIKGRDILTRWKYDQFGYILILLKNNERFVITNLTSKPSDIINCLNVKPEIVSLIVPLIDKRIGNNVLTKKEFETKRLEHIAVYNQKTNKELVEICNNKDSYTEPAISAARHVLKNRENTITNPG